LRFSSPPCMPHAPPTYILTYLFSLIWAFAQHILSSIVSVLACFDYCLKWGSVLPLSKAWHDVHSCFHDIYLQLLAMNFIASTSFMLKNCITLHTLTFDHLVSGPAVIKWKLYSSMLFTVPCSSCIRQSACTHYILKFMVRWCYVMWVMVLTRVLKLPCTFN
jgi:hypothetical protein